MGKKVNFLYHLFFWVVYMMTFALSEWGYSHTLGKAVLFELLFLPSRLIVVYFNWFLLIPKYVYTNRLTNYLLILVLFILIVALLQGVFNLYLAYPIFFPEWMEGQNMVIIKPTRLVQNTLIITSPVAFTTGWKLFLDWKEKQKLTEILKLENTETELKYLKSQINPHFLFNTLNNIYGLSLEKSEKVPGLILRLSEFLSYSLYQSNERLVPLKKEVDLIVNFMDLQIARFADRVILKMDFPKNVQKHYLPPLLLIPFVENAFKHGLKDETQKAKISVSLLLQGNTMKFEVENTKQDPVKNRSIHGGIGLANIKRRLDLLYGKNYVLEVNEQEYLFNISLTLDLTQ